MKIGKAQIWAGGAREVLPECSWALMVSCAEGGSTFVPDKPFTANAGAKALLPAELLEWTPPPFLALDWEDGDVPGLTADWWRAFYKALSAVEGDVVFYCFGGHGRTGTALSILAGLGGLQKQGCPVMWVRKHYCMEAVETFAQVDYIEEVTGKKVLVQPSYLLKKLAEAERDKAKAAMAAGRDVSSATSSANGAADNAGRVYVAGDDGMLHPIGEEGWQYPDSQDWEGPHHGKPTK